MGESNGAEMGKVEQTKKA
jgi:uncharacterized protein (DUF4415 family)